MRILRFAPLLAVTGAACVVALMPRWRPSPPPPPRPALSELNPASQFTHADRSEPGPERAVGFKSPSVGGAEHASPSVGGAEHAGAPPPSTPAVRSDEEAKVQFAYASLEGAAPALGAPSAVTPPAETASLEPSAPPPATPEPAADPALPPPRSPQAVILYRKGDAEGLMALASAATDADERLALEWTSLRADAHPSFDSLATFLKAHPSWPSRVWIREREEAELAAHPQAPGQVAAFFANDPPQSSAGKIAAARAAQAMGRPEEASQIIRALWRDGNVDALSESVILRDFGSSLTKADHAYRADRLLYTGYLSAGARAAALAGPDVLAVA